MRVHESRGGDPLNLSCQRSSTIPMRALTSCPPFHDEGDPCIVHELAVAIGGTVATAYWGWDGNKQGWLGEVGERDGQRCEGEGERHGRPRCRGERERDRWLSRPLG